MSAFELLKTSQNDFVSKSILGVSETVLYTHKNSTLTEEVKTFVDSGNYNKENKDNNLNEIIFANMNLREEPSKLDSILYDGIIWNVRRYTKNSGLWYIEAENSKRNTMSTRKF